MEDEPGLIHCNVKFSKRILSRCTEYGQADISGIFRHSIVIQIVEVKYFKFTAL
jgi:hypothetical protein